jgi:osmotically-inducible protein OsmY
MLNKCCHILVVLGLIALLTGCALYPAVQVAGAAMTGYDAVNLAQEHIPRNSVEGGNANQCQDAALERRLRERLTLSGQNSVAAHVIDGQAYIVGRMPNREAADKAVQIASTVQGIAVIHCKFFPTPTPRQNKNDSRALHSLKKHIDAIPNLQGADLFLDVISGNAILIGKAWTWDQKNMVLKAASSTRGIKAIVDYIVVNGQPATANTTTAL